MLVDERLSDVVHSERSQVRAEGEQRYAGIVRVLDCAGRVAIEAEEQKLFDTESCTYKTLNIRATNRRRLRLHLGSGAVGDNVETPISTRRSQRRVGVPEVQHAGHRSRFRLLP
jgi:hypothetical protein